MHLQLEHAIRLKAEIAEPGSSLRVPTLPLPPSEKPEPKKRPVVRIEQTFPGYDPEITSEMVEFTEE